MLLNAYVSADSALVKTGGKVAEMIKKGRFEDLAHHFITWGIDFLGKLLIALVIFFVGKWIIGKIRKVADKIMSRKQIDEALKGFLKNLLDIFLFVLLIILIINVVGTQTVSLAALIASAGLAIGLAVKDNLANFAGGVMLLFNKPFKNGDYIEAQNLDGIVQNIGILYTTLTTYDNKTIYIPNGPLSTGNITNYSAQTTRRIDIVASIEYGTDVEIVNNMLLDIAKAHPLALKSPEPFARMTKMNDHSLDFTLRVWVKVNDYWSVTHDLNEEIYKQINEKGLVIPFRQLTVHLADTVDKV